MTQEIERPSETGEMPDPASQPEIPVQGPENEGLPDDEGNDEDVPQAPGNGTAYIDPFTSVGTALGSY